MNGKEFHGRTLTVELSKRSKPYNPTPGVCMSNYSYKSNFTFKHIIIYSISVSYTYTYIKNTKYSIYYLFSFIFQIFFPIYYFYYYYF